jgi:hypothetical protein
MTSTKLIFTLGVIIAIMPFLGFPDSWENIMLFVAGAAIAALSFRSFNARKRRNEHEGEHLNEGGAHAGNGDVHT